MDTLVQIVLNSATELVEAAIKIVVYVITDANPDGEDFIVKMVFFVIVVKNKFCRHLAINSSKSRFSS